MMRYHPERENARKPAEMGLDGKSENIKSRLSMCEIHKRLINIPNAWAYVLNRHIIHFCNLPQNLFARFTSRIKTN